MAATCEQINKLHEARARAVHEIRTILASKEIHDGIESGALVVSRV